MKTKLTLLGIAVVVLVVAVAWGATASDDSVLTRRPPFTAVQQEIREVAQEAAAAEQAGDMERFQELIAELEELQRRRTAEAPETTFAPPGEPTDGPFPNGPRG